MNERIQKLAEQAEQYADDTMNADPAKYDKPGQVKVWRELMQEKFAELLIRECITQCENVGEIAEQTNHGEMARKTKATANGCAQMIKWRFGLE